MTSGPARPGPAPAGSDQVRPAARTGAASARTDGHAPATGALGATDGIWATPPIQLLQLQRLAGNGAVAQALRPPPPQPPGPRPVIQRAGGATDGPIPWKGQVLTKDREQLKRLLESLITSGGQEATDTFAYSFLRMDAMQKAGLQLQGFDPKYVEDVQFVFELVLKGYQDERKDYLKTFADKVIADTKIVLAKSKELLETQLKTYDDAQNTGEKPDMDAIRGAAKALAAKRREADAAGETAKAAKRKMIDQNAVPASPMSPFPQPIVPYFPDPTLRDEAFRTNDAWWKLEHEYAALRTTHESTYPVLAMYSANEDGKAAERLEDLPTWGPFSDYRMRLKMADEIRRRLQNIADADADLTEDRAWQLRKMVDATLKGRNATAYQQRWVHDHSAKLAAEAAETQQLIAGVAIALLVVTAVASGGTALAAEGTVAAAVFSSIGATASAASAGISVATAFKDLEEAQFNRAAAATDLDAAKSISSGEPSLIWVAVELLAAGLDVVAATTAFKVAAKAVKSVQAGEEVIGALRAIEGASGSGSTKIIERTLSEAEASGALQRAIVAEGKQFAQADMSRISGLIEQGLGRTWSLEFDALKTEGRILPFTKDGLESALGPRTAERLMKGKDYEKTIGMYHLDSGKAFVRPSAEGDLVGSIVHEMTHRIQGPQAGVYASFTREFEAYAAQRKVMQELNRVYGWRPTSSEWLLHASDWEVAKHIRLEYGYAVPPWVLDEPLAAKHLNRAFGELTQRLEPIPRGT